MSSSINPQSTIGELRDFIKEHRDKIPISRLPTRKDELLDIIYTYLNEELSGTHNSNSAIPLPRATTSTKPATSKSPRTTTSTTTTSKSPRTTTSTKSTIPKSPRAATSIKPTIPKSPRAIKPATSKTTKTSQGAASSKKQPRGQKQVKEFDPNINYDNILDDSKSYSKKAFSKLLNYLDEQYHNAMSVVSDYVYDQLKEYYESHFGPYDNVGAEPSGETVALPYYVGSLNKIKKKDDILFWIKSHPGPYIIEDKVDGLSLLYTSSIENGTRVHRLYTRGGGIKGKDVSHLLNYVHFPNVDIDVAIRGEIVMNKDTFEKYASTKKNARNTTSGIVNALESFEPSMAKDLVFIAYLFLDDEYKHLDIQHQNILLTELGFNLPHPVYRNTIDDEELLELFADRKSVAPYEIDGLVVYQDVPLIQSFKENPKTAIAFKVDGEPNKTVVRNVIWKAGKTLAIAPVVTYDPVYVDVELKQASGYNARFIVKHNIGVGAEIEVIRSGDTIPKIIAVTKPSPYGPLLPDPDIVGEYYWSKSGAKIYLREPNDDVRAAIIIGMIKKLGIKGIGPHRVIALVEAGINSTYGLITASKEDLQQVPGFGMGVASKLYDDLQDRISYIQLPLLMAASGIFPEIGERRFEAIVNHYPHFINMFDIDPNELALKLQQVAGIKDLSYEIVKNIDVFKHWLESLPMIHIESQLVPFVPIISSSSGGNNSSGGGESIAGKNIVFSGFRDSGSGSLELKIKMRGGSVKTSVSKNTDIVVVVDAQSTSAKVEKARKLGIEILELEDFINRFNLK